MANMASVAYAIEGPQKDLEKIYGAILKAIDSEEKKYEEYLTCVNLGFSAKEIENSRLGGEIYEDATIEDGVLRFWAEERWGLQDFHILLKQKFPDIKVYWVVEESGCEVYCTNDSEGKYFPERYWVDTCIDDICNMEYFVKEEDIYPWLSKISSGKVKSKDDVIKFNAENEASDDNYIIIHEFEIED